MILLCGYVDDISTVPAGEVLLGFGIFAASHCNSLNPNVNSTDSLQKLL